MELYGHNKQPLTFFPDYSSYRNHARSVIGSRTNIPPIIVDKTRFIPFQLKKSSAIQDFPTSIILHDSFTGDQTDITSLLPINILYVSGSNGWIVFMGNSNLSQNLTEGKYYMYITDGTNEWYSEDFYICDISGKRYIQFEYYNTYDAFDFIYQGGYKNRIIVKASISQDSEYETFRDEIEDKEKRKYNSILVKKKMFNIRDLILNNSLADAIQEMELHDSIFITENIDANVSQVSEIQIEEIKTDPIDGDYTKMEIKFWVKGTEIVWRDEDTNITNIQEAVWDDDDTPEPQTIFSYLVDELGNYIVDHVGNKILV
jgi:hypothetical protein